jgi:hypothetical protein
MFVVIGCSGSDPLDELHDRYQIYIEPEGGEGDGDYDFECFQTVDCNGDGNFDDSEPGLAGIAGAITIESASDAPYLQIRQYQIEYIPQLSPLSGGGTALPPDLDPTEILEYTINIPSNSIVVDVLPTIMTVDNKNNYVNQGGLATFAQGVYIIRITLYGEDGNNGDFEQTVDITIRMMDIDNC